VLTLVDADGATLSTSPSVPSGDVLELATPRDVGAAVVTLSPPAWSSAQGFEHLALQLPTEAGSRGWRAVVVSRRRDEDLALALAGQRQVLLALAAAGAVTVLLGLVFL